MATLYRAPCTLPCHPPFKLSTLGVVLLGRTAGWVMWPFVFRERSPPARSLAPWKNVHASFAPCRLSQNTPSMVRAAKILSIECINLYIPKKGRLVHTHAMRLYMFWMPCFLCCGLCVVAFSERAFSCFFPSFLPSFFPRTQPTMPVAACEPNCFQKYEAAFPRLNCLILRPASSEFSILRNPSAEFLFINLKCFI